MDFPKIIFRYSWIYDQKYRTNPKMKEFLKKRGEIYPSEIKIKNYIKIVEKEWRKSEKKILREMSEIAGLKWGEKSILCYVVGHARCFSDPLTMRLFENKTEFIDTLTHELIHQLFIQKVNRTKFKKYLEYRDEKYEKESKFTKNHILLHAIHSKIYLNLFNKNRLNRDIKSCQKSKDYRISWKIVESEEADNIIKKFREIIK